MDAQALQQLLRNGELDSRLAEIYFDDGVAAARERLLALSDRYRESFPGAPAALITAAGRTEMAGNHTDHQHGRVLAASVSLDAIACGGPNGGTEIQVHSEGYPAVVIDVTDLNPVPSEEGTSEAIVRGIAHAMADRGYPIAGASIVTTSNVPGGSGLSSSAAFEILVGNALNHFFCNDELTPVELAQIGQYAENVHFGKPSGLMDQMACSIGGVISIDFADPAQPQWERVEFPESGHLLCIIDSGADHADLTDDYAGIVEEMRAVAAHFGAEYLSQVDRDAFWAGIAGARAASNDRAVLRAIHFFSDDARVPRMADALAEGEFDRFLSLVTESGGSSIAHLQNIYSASAPTQQAVGVTIALAEHLLSGRGAVRVHGGGFAGTVQAYVPEELVEDFRAGIDAALGEGACTVVRIRPVGGAVIA